LGDRDWADRQRGRANARLLPLVDRASADTDLFLSACFIALVAATATALLALRGAPAGAVLGWEQQ